MAHDGAHDGAHGGAHGGAHDGAQWQMMMMMTQRKHTPREGT